MILDFFMPRSARRRVMGLVTRWTRWPPVGRVDLGDLKRLTPISRDWGYDRGRPIDRHFIDGFLSRHAEDVRGIVLEVGTDAYTKQLGAGRVTRSEVLHVARRLPGVTLVADLTSAEDLPSSEFDCVILTQVLQFIYDVKAAVSTAFRILKPGGVLLLSVPGIAQISREDMEDTGDFWRFTTAAVERVLVETCPGAVLEVRAHGNVMVAVAMLEGLAVEEVEREDLDFVDPTFQVIITARVSKP